MSLPLATTRSIHPSRSRSTSAAPVLTWWGVDREGLTEGQQAKAKLERKRVDLICGNRADLEAEGFGGDRNRLYLYDRRGRGEWTPRLSKAELGRLILERALVVAADEPSAESAS